MNLALSVLTAFQFNTAQVPDSTLDIGPKLNIDSTLIQLESEVANRYGLDTLDLYFEILPPGYPNRTLGVYSFWNDSLKLNYYEIIFSAKMHNENPDSLLNSIIRHEVDGHYKTDKLMEKLGIQSKFEDERNRAMFDVYASLLQPSGEDISINSALLPGFLDQNRQEITELLLDKMVHEGIGMYYETSGAEPIPVDKIESIDAIKNIYFYYKFLYDVGWNIMHPIIKNYGDKGIEYVLLNMPKADDFSDIKSYQKRVLDALRKEQTVE